MHHIGYCTCNSAKIKILFEEIILLRVDVPDHMFLLVCQSLGACIFVWWKGLRDPAIPELTEGLLRLLVNGWQRSGGLNEEKLSQENFLL